MREVRLVNIKDGMILAKDIYTPKGKILLRHGSRLEEYKEMLSSMNIKKVMVFEDGDDDIAETIPEEERQLLARSVIHDVEEIFKFCKYDTYMDKLMDVVIDHLIQERWEHGETRFIDPVEPDPGAATGLFG